MVGHNKHISYSCGKLQLGWLFRDVQKWSEGGGSFHCDSSRLLDVSCSQKGVWPLEGSFCSQAQNSKKYWLRCVVPQPSRLLEEGTLQSEMGTSGWHISVPHAFLKTQVINETLVSDGNRNGKEAVMWDAFHQENFYAKLFFTFTNPILFKVIFTLPYCMLILLFFFS